VSIETILNKVFFVACAGMFIATISNMSYLYHLLKADTAPRLILRAMAREFWFWVGVFCVVVMFVTGVVTAPETDLIQRIFWTLVVVLVMVGITSGAVFLSAHWWDKGS
jgi:hypothetical protein